MTAIIGLTQGVRSVQRNSSPLADPVERDAVGMLEMLPKWLNLVPMVIQWLWLSLRHGSATLPSSANPLITCGGLAGEGKLEYFNAMGSRARDRTAPFAFVDCDGASGTIQALMAMKTAGLDFPIVAKPDVGWCGFGVRLVRDRLELEKYLDRFPRGERVILQKYISYEGEAGVFYLRHPDAPKGEVFGILLRTFPRIFGDGAHTIGELIAADPRLKRLGRDGLSEPCCDVSRVPAYGEMVRVTTIGSTRVGGLYHDASDLISQEMTSAIDDIAKDMGPFHVGRFDIRYESVGALRKGEGFTIIEVNGAGSEAVHAWDPRYSLRKAYAIVFEKQRRIFEIASAMRHRGSLPTSLTKVVSSYLRQQRLIRRYPPSN